MKKISDMIAHQPFQIVERESIWVNTGEGMDVKGNKWCYCKRFEDKKNGLMVDFAYIPADTEVEVVPTEEEQAIADIKVAALCQSEDMEMAEKWAQDSIKQGKQWKLNMGEAYQREFDTLKSFNSNGCYDIEIARVEKEIEKAAAETFRQLQEKDTIRWDAAVNQNAVGKLEGSISATKNRKVGEPIEMVDGKELQELAKQAVERMGKEADEIWDKLGDMTKPAGNGFYDHIKKEDGGEDSIWKHMVQKEPVLYDKSKYRPEDIERIKREGINADQENKSPYEEYVDAIASKRIVDEYEKGVGYGSNSIWKTWKEMEQAFEIKRLEALVLSYCKDHPEAREWFGITDKRQGEI